MSDIIPINKLELLPNEIFMECFQYLTATEIFYSFDQLNYRFHTLIRNISLYVNFENIRKSMFDRFCNTLLVDSSIKGQIISLQLSNNDTCGQIQTFLSFFSLNDFSNLRSLTLIDTEKDNDNQIKIMLPYLSNLRYLSYANNVFKQSKLSTILPLPSKTETSELYSTSINGITSLTISIGFLHELYHLFKYAPMLKYLKIDLLPQALQENKWCLNNVKANCLRQLIVHRCTVTFETLEMFLKLMPNLTNLTISANYDRDRRLDVKLWQSLIVSALPYLHTFKFKWYIEFHNQNDDVLNEFQQLQTDFWLEQHHWFTNYELYSKSAIIYTIPYISNKYHLVPIINGYSNPSMNSSNIFNNVTDLTMVIEAITNNVQYYFPNLKSLKLLNKHALVNERIRSQLELKHIEYLKVIINLSNLKHLFIPRYIQIESPSIMLQILKEAPQLSSLKLDVFILIPFFDDDQLCEYLNKMIKKLDISSDVGYSFINSKTRDLFCKRFLNLEQLQCSIEKPNDLLFILTQLPRLSIVKYFYVIGTFPEDQNQWLKEIHRN